MNYRHIYHAGNFADVFKHCILVLLLESLLRKDKPFCYLETHAGLGVYDLHSQATQRTLEYLSGIARVLDNCNDHGTCYPQAIAPYLAAINKVNASILVDGKLTAANLRFYPGSPLIARSLLRPQDRMVLMELHQEDVLLLKKVFAKDSQVAVHYYNGYQGLKAFLPPVERRGLVLIDPAFEQTNEFDLMLTALQEQVKSRWPTGIYALWYPIKDHIACNNFLGSLKKMDFKYLVCEMTLAKRAGLEKFIGCGMVIINPPWQIEQRLTEVLSWLWQVLSPAREGGSGIVIAQS